MKYFPYPLLMVASWLILAAPAQASQLENWRFDNGQNRLEFTTDQDVQPQAQLVPDPTRLVIDLPGIVLGRPSFTEPVGNGAVRSVRIGQFDKGTTRIVVELAPGYTLDPNQIRFRGINPRQWTVQLPTPQLQAAVAPSIAPPSPTTGATTTNNAGVTVVPTLSPITAGGLNRLPPVRSAPPLPLASSTTAPTAQPAIIESVQLDNNGRQLVIRANQPLRYESGWERSTGAYRIAIPAAQLARNVKGPQLDANSPVLKVRLRQENSHTVVILVQPATGVRIGELNQPSDNTLALQLQRSQTAVLPPSRPNATIPVPTPPRASNPVPVIPRIPNGRVVVVIDPGHGGPDPGAVGIGGLREKDIVLDIGTQVAALLQKQGVEAVLTRQSDIDLDLEPRVKMAQQVNAAVFVSIHANAIDMSRPDISGLETYYYQNGAELAQMIHSSILQATGVPDRRVRTARFYVLRKTSMPSVLVETGFVTGRDDASRLTNPSYRSQMAAAIARGILQYIQRAARS